MKDFRLTKNAKEIKFGGVWYEVEKKKFPEIITHKIFEINSSLHVK